MDGCDISSLFTRNNRGYGDDDGDDDGSYHDDIGQMCRTQSVDPPGAPHHWSTHVGDGHCQRACRDGKEREKLAAST